MMIDEIKCYSLLFVSFFLPLKYKVKKEAAVVITTTAEKAREQEMMLRTREAITTKQEKIQITEEKVNRTHLLIEKPTDFIRKHHFRGILYYQCTRREFPSPSPHLL